MADEKASEFLESTMGVDSKRAQELAEMTAQAASPGAESLTLEDRQISEAMDPKNKALLTRRVVAGGFLASIASGIVSGLVVEKWSEAPPESFAFSPEFVQFVHEKRASKAIREQATFPMTKQEKYLIRLLHELNNGLYFNDSTLRTLQEFQDRADDEATRLLLNDLQTTQLIRIGASAEAMDVHRRADTWQATNDNERLMRCEKLFSIAYTSLSLVDGLSPQSWGFEESLRGLAALGTDEFGVHIDVRGNVPAVSISSELTIPDGGVFHGVKGAYSLMWSVLYCIASSPGESLIDLSNIMQRALAGFAEQGYERAAWNMSYIAGLHFHRRGKQSDNSFGEYEIRDDLFRLALTSFGQDLSKNPRFINNGHLRLSRNALTCEDPAALGMALFVRSDRTFKSTTAIDAKLSENIASWHDLANLRGDRGAMQYVFALDQIRKAQARELPDAAAAAVYACNDCSWGNYLPERGEIIAAVQSPDIRW